MAAFCHNRRKVCSFRIDRFKQIKSVSETFVRDPAFSLSEYLGSSWGIWRGDTEITVSLIAYPPTSRLFRESSYHNTQHLEELDNGKILCTITTYDTPEIKSWLLSWGSQVQVLEPADLVEEIQKELKTALEGYSKEPL